MTAAWGPPVQQGQHQSEHGGVAAIARAPGVVFQVTPSSQGLGDEIKQDLLFLEGTERVLSARFPHGSGAQSFNVFVVYCQQRRASGAGVTNRPILDATTRVTTALGEVPVIIAGDTQGHPAEQSDQMSCAMRRGWLVDGGWEHRSPKTGCPAPTYLSGGAETRIDYVLTNRVAHCMFRKFRVEMSTRGYQNTVQSSLSWKHALLPSCNEVSVLVLRWTLQKENSCGTHSRLCGLNISMEVPAGWKSSRTILGPQT